MEGMEEPVEEEEVVVLAGDLHRQPLPMDRGIPETEEMEEMAEEEEEEEDLLQRPLQRHKGFLEVMEAMEELGVEVEVLLREMVGMEDMAVAQETI